MEPIHLPILIPALAGVLVAVLPARMRPLGTAIAVTAVLATFTAGLGLLDTRAAAVYGPALELGPVHARFALRIDGFSSWAVPLTALFAVCATLYSMGWYRGRGGAPGRWYAWILLAAAGAATVLLADDLLLLVVGWEIVTLMLYVLATPGHDAAATAPAHALTLLGLGDVALLIGVILIGLLRAGTGAAEPFSIAGLTAAPLRATGPAAAAYLLLLVAAMVKAGAIPFHSWIPSISTGTNPAVMAFLPGSLDKVLGIFLLVRIGIYWFEPSAGLSLAVMLLGAVTLLGAVLLAMVQHDLRRLLSFHAVSQVGYMMLGVGTGTVVGVIGGIYHMVNHAIYKACLFLGAGEVERRAGTADLGELGGLGRTFPVTFGAMFVAALAISGIPPFNGFVSKWLIYQSCVAAGRPFLLVVALFGSALTLASFVKVLHSAFWGPRPSRLEGVHEEPGMAIRLPLILLASLCVLLGAFAVAPMDRFFGPAAGLAPEGILRGSDALAGIPATFAAVGEAETIGLHTGAPGTLMPLALTALLLLGTLAALFVGYLGNLRMRRERPVFVGGEPLDRDLNRFPGTEFYGTVEELPALRSLYAAERRQLLDSYETPARAFRPVVRVLRVLHSGRITDYLAWSLVGLAILLITLVVGR